MSGHTLHIRSYKFVITDFSDVILVCAAAASVVASMDSWK